MALLGTAVLALLLLPAGQAQGPAPGVAVDIAASEAKVSIDAPLVLRVNVTNTAAATGSSLDDANQASVDVSVTGLPEGWVASVSPSSFKLGPGQSMPVDLQVSVAPGAEAAVADIVVTADLVTGLEGLEPILGQVPGASQRASGSDTVRVKQDDSVTRDVLETLGPWIYLVLVLLVVAVLVVIVLTLAGRRALVTLASDTRELVLPPGGRAVFPFRVESLAKQEDAVLLQVSAVPEGWAAFLPVPELVLDPGQVQDLNLVVIAPPSAGDGARQAVQVTATSAKSPKASASLEFAAVVQSGTPLRVQRRARSRSGVALEGDDAQ